MERRCDHCQTLLRFPDDHPVNEEILCPECGLPVRFWAHRSPSQIDPAPAQELAPNKDVVARKTLATGQKSSQDKQASTIEIRSRNYLPRASEVASNRFVVILILALLTTLFIMFAIIGPILETHNQQNLRQAKNASNSAVIIPSQPVPQTTTTPQSTNDSQDSASSTMRDDYQIAQMQATPEISETNDSSHLQSPENNMTLPVDVSSTASTNELIDTVQPVEETPQATLPAPEIPSPLEKLTKALSLKLKRYRVEEPISVDILLLDFEEMIGCRIYQDQLTSPNRQRLSRTVSGIDLQDQTLRQILTQLLAQVGLTFQLREDGNLNVMALDSVETLKNEDSLSAIQAEPENK